MGKDKSPATNDSSSSGLTKVNHASTPANEGNNAPPQFTSRPPSSTNNGHRRQSKISSRQSVSEYFDISCKVRKIKWPRKVYDFYQSLIFK